MYRILRRLEESRKILVIGDVMVDHYEYGKTNRISPEAPVPVFSLMSEKDVLGGAANVAANLKSLGNEVYVMSVVGEDNYGNTLVELLEEKGIKTDFVKKTDDRCTTTKIRLLAQHNQQVMRIDREEVKEIHEDLEGEFLKILEKMIEDFSVVIISDYRKGMITENLCQKTIKICKEHHVKTLIDMKGQSLDKYSGAYLLKPNHKELGDLLGAENIKEDEIPEKCKEMKEKAGCEVILATCGASGMVLLDENNKIEKIKTTSKEVYDVTGAGDTVLAYLGNGIAHGLELTVSVYLANLAAGIKVGKVGTSIVYLEEIRQELTRQKKSETKIVTQAELSDILKIYKDKKIVFTNGCFDVIHTGHVKYLCETAKLGDIMIVGVNSDVSVKRLKGESRPINNEQDRMSVLSAFSFVDYVVMFEEDTPFQLIKMIMPDVLVKGGDYTVETIVGSDIVLENGGEVRTIPFVEGKSSTAIIEKMKEKEKYI